jgi:histone deacetylase 11
VLRAGQKDFHEPKLPNREFISEIMGAGYLFWLNYSTYICKCLEVPLLFLPEFLMRMKVLEPMQLAL